MAYALVLKSKALPWEGDCRKGQIKFSLRTVTWDHGSPGSARDLGILKLHTSLTGRFQHQIHCLAWRSQGLGVEDVCVCEGVAGDYTVWPGRGAGE